MPSQMIRPTDQMVIDCLSVCIYGPPGVGKTSLAQTAPNPLTLDFDTGIHRSFNRKDAMRLDAWHEIEDADPEIDKHGSVVLDTVGRALDTMSIQIVSENAKNGTRSGGLTISGYGELKNRFIKWNTGLKEAKKHRIYLAHEKEERDGESRIIRPDIQGGSYSEVMKVCDLVGYLYRESRTKKYIDFAPTDTHLGKNLCGWDRIEVPPLEENPTFLGDLIVEAMKKTMEFFQKNAEAGKATETWTQRCKRIGDDLTLFNTEYTQHRDELASLGDNKAAKRRVWTVIEKHAETHGWQFNKTTNHFEKKAS